MRSTSVSVMALAIAAQSVGSGLAGAQSFERIVPSTQAWAISADGRVVVGYGNFGLGAEAFRWVEGEGISGLGFLAGHSSSTANGVSANGRVVVGDSYGSGKEAFRWVKGRGMSGLGFLDGGTSSSANAVSADGRVVVGYGNSVFSGNEAYRWVEGEGMSGLGFLGGAGYSIARGVNADGKVVVGTSDDEAFRWVEGVGMNGLGFLDGHSRSEAFGVSADGKVVVGDSYQGSTNEAFRWVEGAGMSGLGFLDGHSSSAANGVSADGTVVVGYSGMGFTFEATRWVEGDPAGMASIAHLLEDADVDLTGWALSEATGVSADGNTIVGNGRYEGSMQGWIARFGPAAGLITPDEAFSSLYSLGQVPNVASNFLLNHLDTSSEYARQHASSIAAPFIQPLGYAEEDDGGVAATPARPLRVFAYGLGSAAFDHDGWSGAAMVGASLAVTDHLVIGGSLGYGAVSSDMDMGGEATIRGPAGTLFIASTPETGFQFLAAGAFSGFAADIRRGYMNGAGTATSSGETDGTGYGGMLRAGYAFAIDDSNRLEPFAAYQAVHSSLNAYTETGGPFPAEISEMSQTDQIGRLGAELRHRFQPEAWFWGSAAWAHRFDKSGVNLSVQLIDLFGVSGTAPVGALDWMEVSAGVSLPVGITTRVTGSVAAGLFGGGSDTLLGRAGVSTAF